jgi:hypothetical protein
MYIIMSFCKSTGHYLSNGMCEFLVRYTQAEEKVVQDLCLPINIMDFVIVENFLLISFLYIKDSKFRPELFFPLL